MSTSSWLKNSSAALALTVNLTACGGGGGGGGATAPVATPTVAVNMNAMAPGLTIPGPTPLNPALYPSIYTSEYYGNYGLDLVHAGNAYAAGLTGAGVTIAVIDNGIAVIPKLQGQVAQQIDLTSSTTITDFHGTSVASVLAAVSNGVYMHGIAYGAKLVDIRAGVSGSFSDANLQTALNIVAGQNTSYGAVNASIVNLSLGGSLSSGFQAGLTAAVNAGKLIVMAAGNDSAANPEGSALFATQAAAKGQVIIAGALTQAGTIASYSNLAGSGAAFYLLAPGDNIATYDNTGAQIKASGTSYAVPMISGAAALLEQEFPNLTAAKVVQILLTTADPLSTGSSATYGAGVLDLAKAIQPIGTLSVPTGATTSSGTASLSGSGVVTTAAFGTGVAAALAGKQVLTLDSFQRGYMVSLSNSAQTMRTIPDYQTDFFNPVSMMSMGARQLKAFDNDATANAAGAFNPVAIAIVPANNVKPAGMDIALSFKGGTVAEIGQHATPMNLATGSLPDMLGIDDAGEPLFMRGELSVLPQASFVTDGYGAALSHRFGFGTLTIAAMKNNANIDSSTPYLPYHNPVNSLVQISGGAKIAGVDLGLGVGMLSERDRTFGAISSGVLSLGTGASSAFITMMGKTDLTDTLELNATYTKGYTSAVGTSASSLFTNAGTIVSTAFAAGLVEHDAFVKGDGFGLQAAQPVRVANARADLLLPVALDADGNIYRSDQRVDLAPTGREIDMQIAYRAPLTAVSRVFDEGDDVQAFVMTRFSPGHDATAPNDYVGGVRVRFAF